MPQPTIYQPNVLFSVAMGKTLSDDDPDAPKPSKKAWDSNAITPGTPFMALLSASLRYWVVKKMNQDAGWQDVRSFLFSQSIHASEQMY